MPWDLKPTTPVGQALTPDLGGRGVQPCGTDVNSDCPVGAVRGEQATTRGLPGKAGPFRGWSSSRTGRMCSASTVLACCASVGRRLVAALRSWLMRSADRLDDVVRCLLAPKVERVCVVSETSRHSCVRAVAATRDDDRSFRHVRAARSAEASATVTRMGRDRFAGSVRRRRTGRGPSGRAVVLRTEPRQAESRPWRASIPIAGATGRHAGSRTAVRHGGHLKDESEHGATATARQRHDDAQLGEAPPVRVAAFAQDDPVPRCVDLLVTNRKSTNR